MISQKYRFHGHGSLRYLYHNGEVLRTPTLTLRWVKNSRRETSRFAVVVSKKVFKRAVKRNMLRRRLYEIIRRDILSQMPEAYDVSLTVFSPDLLGLPQDEVRKQVGELLHRSGIISVD